MRARSAAAVLSLVLGASGCASGPKAGTVHEFQSIVAEPMRVRRPAGPGADPSAGPGGPDYVGHPLPDARYDCRAPATLYEGFDLGAIRACVEAVESPLSLGYRLLRDPVPELALESPEAGSEAFEALPECIRKHLLKLPVPREVFFFAEKENVEGYQCYSSRLDVEADTPLGVRLPIARWKMNVVLPLEVPAKDDAAMLRALIAWSLTPVLKPYEAQGRIQGRAVPDAICGRCFEGVKLPERKFPYPPSWP